MTAPTIRLLLAAALLGACSGDDGRAGANGDDGRDGENGADGRDGTTGPRGADGADGLGGADGDDGREGAAGANGVDGAPGERGVPGESGAESYPLSSVVALTGGEDLGLLVRARVEDVAHGTLGTASFPLPNGATDSMRTLSGITPSVVAKWHDRLTYDADGPRFGANADYIAYFGEGWDAVPGRAPQWNGSGGAAWIWVNHEYVSGESPTTTSAPEGDHVTLAAWMRLEGTLENDIRADVWDAKDVDTFVEGHKREVGGSWLRIVRDDATSTWLVDRGAHAVRYDATSDTRLRITALDVGVDHDDDGAALPEGVASGILADCSGAQTPWGTILSGEENVQDYYGDLEVAWTSSQKLVLGVGFDPGALVTFDVAPSASGQFGLHSSENQRHARDLYGYLAEIDPGVSPSEYYGESEEGVGHRKLGALGRARWENATFVVDEDYELVDGQPIVLYSGDDRRSGRIFKLVSKEAFHTGMTRAEQRALLDEGTVYVAHFAGLDNETGLRLDATDAPPTEAAPGEGRWIEISLTSDDIAPNAAALGAPDTTVGEALADLDWNGIGGFASDDDVRRALFTAAMKIGVMELNRPEDVEWNPRDPAGSRLYVAFTNHNRKTGLDQDGVLIPPATHDSVSQVRPDATGAIFAIEEGGLPASATTFEYYAVWLGTTGDGVYDAANPDNLAIDSRGGVWFGTDGNFGVNGHSDALYFLDLDPAHRDGQPGVVTPTFGRAFRVVAAPADAEATGPAFSSDMRTLFFSVQHPGEGVPSGWPYTR